MIQNKENRMNVNPSGNRVLVKPTEDPKMTKGGLYLPDTAKQPGSKTGTVVAVGPGRMLDDGKTLAIQLVVDDIVLYSEWAGQKVDVDGVEHLMIEVEQVLGTVN